jgi:hypothetical protein
LLHRTVSTFLEHVLAACKLLDSIESMISEEKKKMQGRLQQFFDNVNTADLSADVLKKLKKKKKKVLDAGPDGLVKDHFM